MSVDPDAPSSAHVLCQHRRQRVLHGVNRVFARIYHNVEVLSPPHLPQKGPAILVSNHTSGLDPHLIQSCCHRVITWMMAREYYDQPILRNILDVIGVIPVSRGERDSAATRAALRAVENGEVLGIFAEGKIEPTPELLPFQPGIGVLALKTEAPIHPVYLDGTQRGLNMAQGFFRRQHAVLTFGPPLQFHRSSPAHCGVADVTGQIEQSVRSLQMQVRKYNSSHILRREHGPDTKIG